MERTSYCSEEENSRRNKSGVNNTLPVQNELEIWYTNADSLPNKMNELQCLIAAAETSPDILVITEAKPKNSRYELNPQEMYINGYDIFTNNWDRGRGILVFARSSLQVCEINQEDWPNLLSTWY